MVSYGNKTFGRIVFAAVALFVIGATVISLLYLNGDSSGVYPICYEDHVEQYSDEFGVPKELVYAVAYCESRFDSTAVSVDGAIGVMQLLPSTAKEIAAIIKPDSDDLYDAATNIRFGTYYLSYLYRLTGDWHTAVAAYNAGIGNVRKWLKDERYTDDGLTLKDIPFGETAEYVRRVRKAEEYYKKKLETSSGIEIN